VVQELHKVTEATEAERKLWFSMAFCKNMNGQDCPQNRVWITICL